MRKYYKTQCIDLLSSIDDAHKEIVKFIEKKDITTAFGLLEDCQQGAIQVGTTIDNLEGEGTEAVKVLENYCEFLYNIHEDLANGASVKIKAIEKKLRKVINNAKNEIRNGLTTQYEAVFLPYKASMWDSLESIWMAADEDENCDAYVIPIPYYDRNEDGSLREIHYEGAMYPREVPITHYAQYDLEERHPDMIYIHNPYDDWNLVTCVHPDYFSDRLKTFTDCLVYVPYFSTSGRMSEGQKMLPAYVNADYIVVQSKEMIEQYDESIPREKFLPLGSPKFDRVIRLCKNPPEPPADWKEKMEGKRVYFYNTSIGGMLADTGKFLQKMAYVFNTAKEVEDACILWRPHPLLESTFDSMRPDYKFVYEMLRQAFIDEEIGIYDTTPDIEASIAQCYAYLGDSGTSVTSLFGVAGKPIYLLNNSIHQVPQEDDYKGAIFQYFSVWEHYNTYCITQGTKLYRDVCGDGKRYEYHFVMDLGGKPGDYSRAIAWKGKIYCIPMNVQHVLVIDEHDMSTHKIHLKQQMPMISDREPAKPAFLNGEVSWYTIDYLILYPNYYPDFVRIDLETEKVDYVKGIRDYFITEETYRLKDDPMVMDDRIERIFSGRCIWQDKVRFCNPGGTELLTIDLRTLNIEREPLKVGYQTWAMGRANISSNVLWFLPYRGTLITRWDTDTDEYTQYDLMVEGLKSADRRSPERSTCDRHMIGWFADCEDGNLVFSPEWGNKFVQLNVETGEASEWQAPFDVFDYNYNDNMPNWGYGYFLRNYENLSYRYCRMARRKLYDIDVKMKGVSEIPVTFDYDDILNNLEYLGFRTAENKKSYYCPENLFTPLPSLLSGDYDGEQHDSSKQYMAYSKVNASTDGNCGEMVYHACR